MWRVWHDGSTGWPWPLTYDLTIELVRDIIKVNPCTKFRDHTSNGSAVRVLTDRHTHTHTDGSVFITSTADAGGNEMGICIFHIYRLHPDSLSNIIWNNVINLFNITIWDIPFFLITSGLPVWRLSAIWFHAVRRISHYHTTEIICVLLFFHM